MGSARDDDFPPGMVQEIAQFLSNDYTRKAGQDVYDEVFDTNMMFPLQRKRELAAMMQLARGLQPKVVYEIGSDKAGGLYHWCKSLPTVKRVIASEIRGTPYASAFDLAFHDINFLWLPESSYAQSTILKVERWLGSDRINCLFIDGDKLEFLRDFEGYLPLMSRPGIVFMHDVQDRAPRDAFLTLTQKYRHEEIHDITDSIEAMYRERQGIPAANPYENWLRVWRGKSCSVGVIYID